MSTYQKHKIPDDSNQSQEIWSQASGKSVSDPTPTSSISLGSPVKEPGLCGSSLSFFLS